MNAAEDLNTFLQSIPYARFIGVRAELAGDEMTTILDFHPDLIGSSRTKMLHGGVIGAFMEITALAQLVISEGPARQPRVIGATVEYMRGARNLTTYARADIKKVGRRVANVRVEAWQDQRSQPVAALRAHFLVTPTE